MPIAIQKAALWLRRSLNKKSDSQSREKNSIKKEKTLTIYIIERS
jgi:hypothetical protein